MKTCAACSEQKPLEAFSRQARSKDGRYPYCKTCAKARLRAAYQARGKRSWMNDKTCSWCLVLKPRTDFRKEGTKVVARCLACEADVAEKESAGLKRCNICREWLSSDAFYPSHWKKTYVTCKACIAAENTKPAYAERRRNYGLLKTFGISLEQYRELLRRQDGKCPICKVPFEPNNFSYPVDHAHGGSNPGVIRAILHNDCNRFVMWMHEDSAQLRAAADLIDSPLTDWVVPEHMVQPFRKDRQK